MCSCAQTALPHRCVFCACRRCVYFKKHFFVALKKMGRLCERKSGSAKARCVSLMSRMARRRGRGIHMHCTIKGLKRRHKRSKPSRCTMAMSVFNRLVVREQRKVRELHVRGVALPGADFTVVCLCSVTPRRAAQRSTALRP